MEVIEPQTSAHTLLHINNRVTQMEFFFPNILNEIKKLKSENQRLQSEIDELKVIIRDIKIKK